MATLRNTVIGALLVFILATIAYYFHRKGVEAEQGDEYSIFSAPLDMLGAISGALSPGTPPLPPEPTEPSGVIPEPVLPPGSELSLQARAHYQAAEFGEALPLLERALRGVDASTNIASVTQMRDRARLFYHLLASEDAGAGLRGPPVARIALAGGEPFLAAVEEETGDEVTFRREDGVGARVRKRELKAHQIARTPEEKKALAADEYLRRQKEIRSAGHCLELARFCRRYELDDHVTYLLERAFEESGDDLEQALYGSWQTARNGGPGNADLAVTLLDILKQFFRDGVHTKAAIKELQPAPARAADPGGNDPGSGIGSVGQRSPRVSNPEVNKLLEEADRLRREGHEHYMGAQPGQEDRAEHRKKALAAYTGALEIYEKVEDEWGVELERIFKEIYERRYQLLKDTPIK